MNEPRSFLPDDESVVVVPAGAKELLAELAAIREAEMAAEVRKVETVHALCLVYGTVDEDAFGEAAEQLIYRGEQGTPPVAEYLSLEVSALLGISPGSGAALIGQVLNCVYRHPVLWDAVRDGARHLGRPEPRAEVARGGYGHRFHQDYHRGPAPQRRFTRRCLAGRSHRRSRTAVARDLVRAARARSDHHSPGRRSERDHAGRLVRDPRPDPYRRDDAVAGGHVPVRDAAVAPPRSGSHDPVRPLGRPASRVVV